MKKKAQGVAGAAKPLSSLGKQITCLPVGCLSGVSVVQAQTSFNFFHHETAVALEQNNQAPEFDMMLRRHLKQGGVPVSPCVGFDADTASAYLERALTSATLLRYEAHLASCVNCRQHLVALSRLTSALDVAVARPLPTQVKEPLWSRWQAAFDRWFDFSEWHWGLNSGMALGATACALLLAVLGLRVWRQVPQAEPAANATVAMGVTSSLPPNPAFMGTASENADPREQLKDGQLLSAAPANAPQTLGLPVNEQVALETTNTQPSRPVQIPRPTTPNGIGLVAGFAGPVGPAIKAPTMEFDAVNPGIQPVPPVPRPMAGNLISSFNQPASNLAVPVRLTGLGSASATRPAAPLSLFPGESDQKELVAELVLPKPGAVREREGTGEKVVNEQAKAARNRELLNTLRGRSFGFMPSQSSAVGDKNAEARTKEADVKEAQAQSKPLMKRLNGHVFYFDHGFWIDEEYNSETKLPLKRLTRGSQEYQQTLIENPSLEQFFQLTQVIVVWKGIVYEVRK